MPTQQNTPIVARRFYPALSSVVSLDNIPNELAFIKTGLTKLLNKIYYKDLQFSKSPRGDAAFYSLSIVSRKKLSIEIPGTGIGLVLNPDLTDSFISAFPINIPPQQSLSQRTLLIC